MRNKTFGVMMAFLAGSICFTNLPAQEFNEPNVDPAEPKIIWDISERGLFDTTNKAYSIENGRVTVDIEEMAHNFVDAADAQFGWEMIGWTIGVKVTNKVAPNPVFKKHLQET